MSEEKKGIRNPIDGALILVIAVLLLDLSVWSIASGTYPFFGWCLLFMSSHLFTTGLLILVDNFKEVMQNSKRKE